MTARRKTLAGLLLAALAAAPLPAVADGGRIDADGLVRFGDELFHVRYEDWVATEPESQHTIRKIGYGRAQLVSVSTTATGTYSTDGLISPHVRYPGIEVERAGPAGFSAGIWALGGGRGWVSLRLERANSIVVVNPHGTWVQLGTR